MIERVVVVSDCTDVAFAEMRGQIYKAAAHYNGNCAVRIEPLVPVAHFSVINASFVVRLVAEAYPENTLIMFIMNSVAQRTERIVGRTSQGGIIFEGTNTGAAGWLIEDLGVEECYELTDPGFVPFGGKFVHAPAVGKLAAGAALDELGEPFPAERIRRALPGDGEIVHIDNFGNAKFKLDTAGVEIGDRLTVDIEGELIEAVYGRRMMEHPDNTWVVYPGSSFDLHELGEVRGPGLLRFPVHPGARLTVKAHQRRNP